MSVRVCASCGRARAMSGRGNGHRAAAGLPDFAGPNFARAYASFDRNGARSVRPNGYAAARSAISRGVSTMRRGAMIGAGVRDTNRCAANPVIAIRRVARRGG